MKDQEGLAGKLRSTYFARIDKANIVRVVEGLRKDVDRDYHVCVAARPFQNSVSISIIRPRLCPIC